MTTTPCGEDCRAPYCICDHPDDCTCGCADDHTASDDDRDCTTDGGYCTDPHCDDCPLGDTDDDQPCAVDCACAWCTDEDDDTPNITTIHANPAYL